VRAKRIASVTASDRMRSRFALSGAAWRGPADRRPVRVRFQLSRDRCRAQASGR